MTVNFPSSPSQGDTYTYEAITYTFDGEKWVGSTASSFNDVTVSGASANVILQGNDSITTDQTFTFNDQGGKLVPYQQGVWTPTVSQGTHNGPVDRQSWARIGNTVMLSGYVTDLTDTSSAVIAVESIPYSASIVVSGSASSSRVATTAGGVTLCYVRGGIDDQIQFLCTADSASNAWVQPRYSDTTAGNNSIYFSITYRTDDTTWTPINGATVS
ncbi:hypothetical protein [Synechococcus phage S-N03]|uniref:Uncharacterized protein n=1 Tax=Synechococcus phage S-N03 TaxID=2718943 RepID=A0A6G8R5G8_9CAUD|nr:hypothetical protein PQC09_gp014 [Synechococcus phage S-N03]QIN96649.1 hypothetical protein [Synechococcus phage S-N03]